MGSVIAVLSEALRDFDVDTRSFETWRAQAPAKSIPLAVCQAMRIIRWRPNVVHVHLSERGSFLREGGIAVLLGRLGAATCATLHGADFLVDHDTRLIYRWLSTRILTRLDLIFVLGPQTASLVSDSLPTLPLLQMMNPVKVSEPWIPTGGLEVLFAGEVGERKGADRLLKAWELVVEAIPSARLTICGPLAMSLPDNLPHGVSYVGPVSREECLRLLARASVCCLPARREVLPMFLLESLAGGKRVVTTGVGEVFSLEDCPGVRIVSSEPGSIASAILAALRTPLTEEESRGMRNWVMTHIASEVVAEGTRRAYLDLLEEARGRPKEYTLRNPSSLSANRV